MFTTELFNLFKKIDSGDDESLIIKLLKNYPAMLTSSAEEQLRFLLDVSIEDYFHVQLDKDLHIYRDYFDLKVFNRKQLRLGEPVKYVYDGNVGYAHFERYSHYLSLISEGECIVVLPYKYFVLQE